MSLTASVGGSKYGSCSIYTRCVPRRTLQIRLLKLPKPDSRHRFRDRGRILGHRSDQAQCGSGNGAIFRFETLASLLYAAHTALICCKCSQAPHGKPAHLRNVQPQAQVSRERKPQACSGTAVTAAVGDPQNLQNTKPKISKDFKRQGPWTPQSSRSFLSPRFAPQPAVGFQVSGAALTALCLPPQWGSSSVVMHTTAPKKGSQDHVQLVRKTAKAMLPTRRKNHPQLSLDQTHVFSNKLQGGQSP